MALARIKAAPYVADMGSQWEGQSSGKLLSSSINIFLRNKTDGIKFIVDYDCSERKILLNIHHNIRARSCNTPAAFSLSLSLSLSHFKTKLRFGIFYPLLVCKIYENRLRYRRDLGFGSRLRSCNSNIKLSPAFALSEPDDTSAIGGHRGFQAAVLQT